MKKRNQPLVWISSLLLLATVSVFAEHHEEADKPADAESQAKAKAILEAADEAIKKVEAASFKGRLEPSGIALNFVQASKGYGVMSGWQADYGMPKYFHGVSETTRDGKDVKIEGGGNGDTFYVIDHANKKGYEDMDPGVMGSMGNALRGIGLMELVHPSPFDDELESELTYLGTEDVDGVLCDKINVVYTGGRGESTWFIAQEDHLPRRRVRHFKTPQGDGAIEITISELNIGPKIDSSQFTMTLPEGYESIDDFAP